MNDTLASVRSPGAHSLPLAPAVPSTAIPNAAMPDAAHLTFAERLQFRLGLWLLVRSARRRHGGRDHHDHARRLANARLHDERDRVALRNHLLQGPRL